MFVTAEVNIVTKFHIVKKQVRKSWPRYSRVSQFSGFLYFSKYSHDVIEYIQ